MVSDFYREKISACERMNNLLEFDYTDFEKNTIKFYLDTIYKDNDKWEENRSDRILKLLKLVEFLKWEGKNMISGNAI